MSSQRRTASRRWLYCGECCGCSCTPMRMGCSAEEVTVQTLDAYPTVGFPDCDDRRPRGSVAAFWPVRQRLVDVVVVALAGMLHADGDQVVGHHGPARLRPLRHGQELLGLTAVGALERDGEQAVIGLQRVAVGGDPQVSVVVEGDVVGARDGADLVLVESGEVGVGRL